MNTSKFKLMTVFIIIGLFIGIGLSSAESTDYLGNFCWNFESSGASGIVKLGVLHMGDGHYLLSGIATVTSPKFEQGILYGNAEFIKNNIQLILIHSNSDADSAWNEISHCVLDPHTLNGFCKGIDSWTNNINTDQEIEYIYSTLTFTLCP